MYNITNKRLMLTVYYKKREELASTVEAHFSGRGWNKYTLLAKSALVVKTFLRPAKGIHNYQFRST